MSPLPATAGTLRCLNLGNASYARQRVSVAHDHQLVRCLVDEFRLFVARLSLVNTSAYVRNIVDHLMYCNKWSGALRNASQANQTRDPEKWRKTVSRLPAAVESMDHGSGLIPFSLRRAATQAFH